MFSARFCPKWIPGDRQQSVEFIPRRDYSSPRHRAACQQPGSNCRLASSVHVIPAPAQPGTTLLLHCNIHKDAAFLLLRGGETVPKWDGREFPFSCLAAHLQRLLPSRSCVQGELAIQNRSKQQRVLDNPLLLSSILHPRIASARHKPLNNHIARTRFGGTPCLQ